MKASIQASWVVIAILVVLLIALFWGWNLDI